MRYLDRDLPPTVYDNFRDLIFVRDLDDLDRKLDKAKAWGITLLQEMNQDRVSR